MSRQVSLFFAWFISVFALFVTLYSSVVLLMPVCPLCWYQRICLYPLAIILGIGAYQNDRRAAVYALPLVILGMLFALYHTLLQKIPSLESVGVCQLNGHCSDVHLHLFGFITYPMLSFIASFFIFILLILSLRES